MHDISGNYKGISTAVLFGAGNVGTHLGGALVASGIKLLQVFSRTRENAEGLARQLKADAITDVSSANVEADFWLIAVSDQAVAPLVDRLPSFNGVVAHTSGSVPMEVLSKFVSHGVFYPFQTFSKKVKLDTAQIPFLIEGGDRETTQRLISLARLISSNVIEAKSSQRALLHVAAVFSCNFVNHLYTLSAKMLENHALSFDLLKPLIEETTRKALSMPPERAQTGPAVRNDLSILEKHMEMLAGDPGLKEVYRLLSDSILSFYCHKDRV